MSPAELSIIFFLQLFVIVGALVSIVPLILAFVLLQRFWQSGLAAGGVK